MKGIVLTAAFLLFGLVALGPGVAGWSHCPMACCDAVQAGFAPMSCCTGQPIDTRAAGALPAAPVPSPAGIALPRLPAATLQAVHEAPVRNEGGPRLHLLLSIFLS